MASRLTMLHRLAALYGMVEQMEALSLARAGAELHEAESMIQDQLGIAESAGMGARQALSTGDRPEWLMSESQRELAIWNSARLEGLRVRREALKKLTAELYSKSLVEREQMETLVGNARSALQVDVLRREQAAADDRHASRLRWLEMQEAQRMKRG